MRNISNLKIILAAIALAIVPAKADIYHLSLDHCSGGCVGGSASDPIGTVTVTQQATDVVRILVEEAGTGFRFVTTGAGNDLQFFFNILGDPTIAVSNVTAGYELVSTTPSATGLAGNGYNGSFEYAIRCVLALPCGPGGSEPTRGLPPLSFDVTATGLTPASFFDTDGTSDGAVFAADVLSKGTGKTGMVGATRICVTGDRICDSPPQSLVPETSSLILFGTAAFALLVPMRLRKLAKRS